MKKILIPVAMLMLIAAGCNKTAATNNSSANTDQNSNSASAAQQSAASNATSADANAQTNVQTPAQTQTPADAGLHYSGEADAESMNQPEVIGVDISAQGFSPADVTINKGDFVQFTNQDAAAGHQPVSDKGLFGANASLALGQNYRFQFMAAGTFTYHDKTNAALTGTVTVK